MKRIYFVRHGESVSNAEGMVQGLTDPLSLEGEKQVLRIAERAQNLGFTELFSSDAVRARMTAEAISQATKIPIEESTLFREVKCPTSLIKYANLSEEFLHFMALHKEHAHEAHWHFEDEENYHDLVMRANKVLEFLLMREADEVCVVTHGHFLRFLLATMVLGDELTPKSWDAFAKHFGMTNTGVTLCAYQGTRHHPEEKIWRILTWNDHAHFAE